MTNNKGPVINGEQLVTLINAIQSNALVGVDFEAFSKELVKRKFQLVKQDLDILFDRTQERVFELSKDTRKITFDIGEHASKYINLGITLLFISNSNTKLNKEVTINIPKSLFIHFLTSKEPIIEPSYSILSTNDIDVEVFYNVSVFSKNTGETVKVLTLDMETSNLTIYDEIKVIVDTLANNFKEIDTTPLTLTQELVRRKSIKKNVNIGYYPYAIEDGTLVRSDIVRHITCRTHDEMENIINNNKFSPSEFSLVPIEEDTSNRILEIEIKTYEPNTTITLTNNESQSKIFKVNWGDGTEDTRIRHKYATAGTYTIKIYNRLDEIGRAHV